MRRDTAAPDATKPRLTKRYGATIRRRSVFYWAGLRNLTVRRATDPHGTQQSSATNRDVTGLGYTTRHGTTLTKHGSTKRNSATVLDLARRHGSLRRDASSRAATQLDCATIQSITGRIATVLLDGSMLHCALLLGAKRYCSTLRETPPDAADRNCSTLRCGSLPGQTVRCATIPHVTARHD